ncbi:sigma-70 family RNA polymerase sigma factor [Brevibacillus fortis]|uniref:RNA polymerase sigma factor n=1 Tax=Brevibacillus fortis TaxID=2126352 RepID=A0A2P7V1W6_9BACL|nr:sigma-70 family RNA polymerase sigma factor [Brevibacillus fortis]PSJ93209.1 RNA polymerase [Brevibacillus fortis]
MNASAKSSDADWTLQLTNEEKLTRLMGEYGDNIVQLAYLIVKDRGIAEDITQEVFLKAYRGLDQFRHQSSVKTWLYRIAINESRKYLRSWSFRQIFSTYLSKEETPPEKVDTANVESAVIGRMSKVQVAEQVMKLSPLYRKVMVLHYYEDLSIKEIAQVLDISEDTVRTQLSRARKHFKALCEKEGLEWT